MTTSTTDAEAIARIIDPSAFNPDAQTIGKPAYWEAKREWAVRTATAILSYLASRREAIANDDIADALERCDWSGAPIGNKAIIASAIERLRENVLFCEDAADHLALIDYISDKIGLPKDEELSRETFSAWLSASRRGAQEPALYQCELEDGRIEHFSAVFGEVLSSNGVRVVRRTPLYTDPPSPAPAGEVERLRGALDNCIDTLALVEQPSFIDKVYATDVAILGDRIGYGALMSCASALWRLRLSERGSPVGGEFVSGPCHATVLSTLKQARAALNGGRSE